MSSSSSTNPKPELNSTLNIPPDPGNTFQSPLTGSSVSSNSHSIPIPPSQTLITFRHVLQYYWRGINHNITPPTPPQIWLAENVYPLVSPMRMICFTVSQTSFMFLTTAYERFKKHLLLKSVGEFVVMRVMSLLISGIEQKQRDGSFDVAALITCLCLAADSLCIIMLMKPGHHYSLLDAALTLTLHLGLDGEGIYAITADAFVFVMLAIKNLVWHHIAHMHARDEEHLQLVWFHSHHLHNLSSV
ncbi:hypothetical protein CR513_54421, partial [Mucuna pruriens]